MAAQQVATNLDEDSPAIQQIQDTMEAFNKRWNNIASALNSKIRLVSFFWTCVLHSIAATPKCRSFHTFVRRSARLCKQRNFTVCYYHTCCVYTSSCCFELRARRRESVFLNSIFLRLLVNNIFQRSSIFSIYYCISFQWKSSGSHEIPAKSSCWRWEFLDGLKIVLLMQFT